MEQAPTNVTHLRSGDALIRRILVDLSIRSIKWAFLAEPPADLGSLEDCDIACESSAPDLLSTLGSAWIESGILPFLHTHYDVGRGDALWIWGDSERAIVHLDILSDPDGIGRLGLSTDSALASSATASELPTVDEDFQAVYRLAKDLVKKLGGRPDPAPKTYDSAAFKAVFGKATFRETEPTAFRLRARKLVGRIRRGGSRLALQRIHRIYSRLRQPTGQWIHISGPFAETVSDRLVGTYSQALAVHLVSSGHLGPWRRFRAWVLRLKPTVLITTAEVVGAPPRAATASVSADDPNMNLDEVESQVMRQLAMTIIARAT